MKNTKIEMIGGGAVPQLADVINTEDKRVKDFPLFEDLKKFIRKEKLKKMPLEAIVMSRFQFDMFERWLEILEVINDNTVNAPLFMWGIHIQRASDDRMTKFTPIYRNLLQTSEEATKNLLNNIESFGIKSFAADTLIGQFKNRKDLR